eukprot:1014816-Amphidinium_carterae.1
MFQTSQMCTQNTLLTLTVPGRFANLKMCVYVFHGPRSIHVPAWKRSEPPVFLARQCVFLEVFAEASTPRLSPSEDSKA